MICLYFAWTCKDYLVFRLEPVQCVLLRDSKNAACLIKNTRVNCLVNIEMWAHSKPIVVVGVYKRITALFVVHYF